MSESGIYSIRCSGNGKIYVGSAVHIGRRWSNHLSDLRKRRHANIHLQRCADKFGLNSLVFGIIELVADTSQLLVREQIHIDRNRSFDSTFGLNIQPRAANRLGTRASEETREKLREGWKRRRINHPFKSETGAKISSAMKGRKMSKRSKAALLVSNARRQLEGVSEATKDRQRAAWVKRKASPNYLATLVKSRVTDEQKSKAVHLYKEGFTSTQIGPMLGMSASNVRLVLSKQGMTLRPKFSRPLVDIIPST